MLAGLFVLAAGGQQRGLFDALYRHLRGGVEGADALEVIAEELGSYREFFSRAPSIDNAAAHREIADLLDHWNTIVAERGEFLADIAKLYGVCPHFCGVCPQRNDGRRTSRDRGREGR